jgi:hypothetical protein
MYIMGSAYEINKHRGRTFRAPENMPDLSGVIPWRKLATAPRITAGSLEIKI